MKKLKPISNKVLILPDDTDTVSAGGILLAPREEEAIQKGTAVAVGPGLISSEGVLLPMQVAEGDKVLFDRKRAAKIEMEGIKYYLTFDTEILVVIE